MCVNGSESEDPFSVNSYESECFKNEQALTDSRQK